MNDIDYTNIKTIEHEIIMLLRRADFKRTLDGDYNSLERSSYLILKILRNRTPLTISALADFFQLDLSTISRQATALEKKGYIRRFTDAHNLRINVIEITETGIKALDYVQQQRLQSYEEILFDWTKDEIQIFSTLLSRLNRKLESRRRLRQYLTLKKEKKSAKISN